MRNDLRPDGAATAVLLRAAGATAQGRRPHNEDRFTCDPEQGLFVVVDGLGGHAAGEVAATLACDLVARRMALRTGTTAERLREAIAAANNEIYRRSLDDPRCLGMGCVLTAAVVEEGLVTVGHVGDTRLYVAGAEGLRKVTRDHSVVGVQEDAGVLTEAEALRHPRRNEILRDVGSRPHQPDDEGFVDVYTLALGAGDVLVLCSDGLTDVVPSALLLEALRAHAGDPAAAVHRLLALADEGGSPDNVTVIVAEAAAGGPRPDVPEE